MKRIESISDPQIKGVSSGRFSIVIMTMPLQIRPANNGPLSGVSRQYSKPLTA